MEKIMAMLHYVSKAKTDELKMRVLWTGILFSEWSDSTV